MAAWRREHLFPRPRRPSPRTGDARFVARVLDRGPLTRRSPAKAGTQSICRCAHLGFPFCAGMSGVDAGLHDFPYTGAMVPRVTRLSGEARNKMVAATSSTFGHK